MKKLFQTTPIVIFFFVSLCWAVGPYALSRLSAGSAWRGVYPEMTHEYFLYLAQMKTAASDFPFGNPFFIEYEKEKSAPNLSFEITLASLPLSFGLSPSAANMLNTFVWSFIFLCAVYFFCVRWKLSPLLCAVIPLIVFFGYSPELMLRPAIMQIVYPTFMIFLCTLLFWVNDPNTKRSLLLGVILGLSAYFYSFTTQVALVSFSLCAAAFFLTSSAKRRMVQSALLVFITAFVIAIPFVSHFLEVAHHPQYAETLRRYDTVYSRLPDPRAYEAGAFFLALLFLYVFSRRKLSDSPEQEASFGSREGWIVVFSALFGALLVMMSNVVTGLDVDHFHHTNRFALAIILLLSLPLAVLLVRLIERDRRWWIRIGAGFVIALLSAQAMSGLIATREFLRVFPLSSRETQKFSGTLLWLSAIPGKDVVLDTTSSFYSYIPVYTKHKVVFMPSWAKMFLVSQEELDERYLLSNIGTDLSVEKIEDGQRILSTISYENYRQRIHWYSLRCRLLFLPESVCPKMLPEHNPGAMAHYADMKTKAAEIRKNPEPFLKKYHVGIVIVAKGEGVPAFLKDAKPAYQDESYAAYRIAK